ncbi:uncharacterized protein LOC103578182 isoform X2 [Microplitis demolitor]|uniref:uncharacterized protein LOC103578182 isoform X2 n=1 Tax=Microplitis demolitor TaxID=69319 RepID=UPI0006D4ED8C|nr:uncharacterized protein LOC103578182 isoform X2 [Microplitis demolitor]
MDVVATDVNGGNAEVARDDDVPDPGVVQLTSKSPKVDEDKDTKDKEINDVKEDKDKDVEMEDDKKDVKVEEVQKKEEQETIVVNETEKIDEQEVNGDVKGVNVSVVKKNMTPVTKRKLRKTKANSTSAVESEHQDSPSVNANTNVNANSNNTRTRNQKRKLSEPDNHTSDDSMDFIGFDSSSLLKVNPATEILLKLIAEAEAEISSPQPSAKRPKRSLSKGPVRRNVELKTDDHQTVAKGKKKLDKSDGEVDSGNAGAVTAVVKNDAGKSPPSAKTPVVSRRGMRNSHAPQTSSIAAAKQKVSADVTNPEYKEPFKYGWKRELVYKTETDSTKKVVEVSYYTPKGKKVRSLREIAEFLNTKELTVDNFIFTKEPTGINDPQYEIIKDETTPISTPVSAGPAKKIGTGKKAAVTKRLTGKISPTPAKTLAKNLPLKTSTPGIKVKVPVKRGSLRKDVSPPKETDVLGWTNSSNTTRRSQAATEKTTPYKSKRSLKTKLQEPCSIRCSMSMGLIPSLQCCVCLCLYHPECVGHAENSTSEDYVCKNCRHDNEEGKKVSITPPPLIPISMIGTQNVKSLFPPIDRQSPPRVLSKNSKPDSEYYSKNSSKSHRDSLPSTGDNKLNTAAWYSRRDFMQRQDGSEPKPAQNIALLAGKRYIVVPKNNAGSVQPAIRPNKTQNKLSIDDVDKINYPREIGSKESKAPKEVSTGLPSEEIVKDKNNEKSQESKTATIDVEEPQRQSSELSDKIDDTSISETPVGTLEKIHKTLEDQVEDDALVQEVKDNDQVQEQENSHDGIEENVPATVGRKIDSGKEIADDKSIEEKDIERSESMDTDGSNASDEMPIKESEFDAVAAAAVSKDILESEASELTVSPVKQTAGNLNEEKNQQVGTNDKKEVEADKKKAVAPLVEVDQRQYFMSTVCSGYNALSRVFQYLKVQELLRAARVCKMWRDLAAHPALWKTVRMKNSQVTDWDGLVATLQRHGTEHLDLRKMLIAPESDSIWQKFVSVIPNVKTLIKLELCRCPVMVVEEVIKVCPQLQVLSAMSIKCDWLNLEDIGNLKSCEELRLKAITGMSLHGDLTPLQNLTQLSHLSLTSVKELGKKKIDILASLVNLESLELGECSDFSSKFGTAVLCKLTKLERLRLEKGQGTCCTFDILKGVAKLDKLHQLELVNFDVKNGFDKHLANCKNIKRLLIIPTYISQSATSNNMVLGGVTELSDSLTYFVWGVTLELLRVTQLFVDQCNQMNKQVSGDSIPVLKPVPCLKLIEDADDTKMASKAEEKSTNSSNPQVDILPLPQLQKLLLTALPKTRVKILMIPFQATWRQSISDTASQ